MTLAHSNTKTEEKVREQKVELVPESPRGRKQMEKNLTELDDIQT